MPLAVLAGQTFCTILSPENSALQLAANWVSGDKGFQKLPLDCLEVAKASLGGSLTVLRPRHPAVSVYQILIHPRNRYQAHWCGLFSHGPLPHPVSQNHSLTLVNLSSIALCANTSWPGAGISE